VKHLILRVERVYTRYGSSIVLTLWGPESRRYEVNLPRRYYGLITDYDITATNYKQIVLHLVYKGTCRLSSQHLLNIVQDNSP
jgi:dTDP-4-dehydrorhamnose reductase